MHNDEITICFERDGHEPIGCTCVESLIFLDEDGTERNIPLLDIQRAFSTPKACCNEEPKDTPKETMRIVSYDNFCTEVWLNGIKQENIINIDFRSDFNGIPTLKLTFIPSRKKED